MTWAELIDWSYWVHSILGGAHFGSALAALLLGPVLFFRRKGTMFHRLAGYGYVLSMLTVNITALTMYDFTGRPNLFHVFAVMSLASLLPAMWALQRGVRLKSDRLLEVHARLMMWSYFGLAAAGLAQVATRLLPPLLGSFGQAALAIGVALFAASAVCWVIFKLAAPRLAKRYSFAQLEG